MDIRATEDRAVGGRLPGDIASQAAELVSRMSIEEQALLLSGDGWWRTHGIERLGVAPIWLTDGPHGLRKSPFYDSVGMVGVPATCFPTASALAATWNIELVREVGAALGREAQAADVQVLLGPGVNIKRSPLGGRNFEYFSEDPLLSGHMAAAHIDGVQGEGVGTALKHFVANDQETERMSTSSDVDERTLHEIYLQAFEIAVRKSQPWTVMNGYNLVNGTYAAESHHLLTEILREQWGFDGLVMTDWGGTDDRVLGVAAGTDLEMPDSGDFNRKKIIAAAREGRLSKAALARAATAVVALSLRAHAAHRQGAVFDARAHHALARRVGGEAIVLLKNADELLPLPAAKRLAVIGSFAKLPRYQGAGSSIVNAIEVSNTYDELVALLGAGNLIYSEGCDTEGETTDDLLEQAARDAAAADIAIVFAGLPGSYESEGFDRRSIDLPAGHVRLIEAVAQAQPNVVVVLLNGSAVAMPWADRVKGIVEAWLGGQAGGGAIADVLCGRVNPSGKLSETFPVSLEQTPTFPHFPGRAGHALYGEGVFVGYRYYDTKRLEPLFPFGFGLSYTRFSYTGIRAHATRFDADAEGSLEIEVSVRNVGAVAGKEVVQLYVSERAPAIARPDIELRAFGKVALEPGEEKTLIFTLRRRDFAYYDAQAHAWSVNPGTFDLRVGGSSRDLPLQCSIDVRSVTAKPLTPQSLIRDVKRLAGGEALYAELARALGFDEILSSDASAMAIAVVDEMPLSRVVAFSRGLVSDARLDEIIGRAG